MKPGIYLFKEEFCTELGIPQNQYNRRKDELIEWLYNFYEFEILDGRPIRINVIAEIGDYEPLPRKKYDKTQREKDTEEKLQKYGEFTILSLGIDYEPNSKSRIARKAIDKFGRVEYRHKDVKTVARKYITPAFNKHAESNDEMVWVWYSTYKELNERDTTLWHDVLTKFKMNKEAAANYFYIMAQGEDIDQAVNVYKAAMDMMKFMRGDFPVRVKKWRLKQEEEE